MRKVYLLCLMIVFFILGEFVLAANATSVNFETSICSDDEKEAFIEHINLQPVCEDNNEMSIQCFDVHLNGNYALAFGKGSNCNVYVYDPNGVYLYGFRFDSLGAYGIQFRGDMLEIYFVRGDSIAVIDETASCIDVQKVLTTRQNLLNERKLLDCCSKELNGKTYVLERDLDIGDSYSRFVVINKNGERTVLVDVSTDHTIQQILLIASLVVIFVITIIGAYHKRNVNQ